MLGSWFLVLGSWLVALQLSDYDRGMDVLSGNGIGEWHCLYPIAA